MQIYHFNTVLNFGIHKGKAIRELIAQNEYSYLLWCLKNHDKVCFTEEVFDEIKINNIASNELLISILDGDTNKAKILEERDVLKLEVINLKKMLSFYKNESNNSHNTTEIYEDYEQENTNWLAEAAGTDDPETMNDVYWNLD